MLQLANCIKLPLTIDLSLNVIHFIFSRLEVILNALQDLLDRLFVSLCIIPFNDRLVELVFHIADATVVPIDLPLVFASLEHVLCLEFLPARQRSDVLIWHLNQFADIESR